jgi:F-type H+-transporting ATPase subunit delta
MKIQPAQYAQLAQFVLQEKKDEAQQKKEIANLAKLIVQNNDQSKLEAIIEQLDILEKKSRGVVNVKITSAKELSVKEEQAVVEMVIKKMEIKKELIELEKEVDISLIGGVNIQIDNQIIVGSLKAKLDKLANALS